jgi:hypothetical protein
MRRWSSSASLPGFNGGATINAGFLNSQRARECPSPGTAAACSGTVRAQIAELTELLASARRDRSLDLVLLTEHEMISVSGAVLAVCSSSAKSSQATTIARTRRKSVR